LADSVSVADTLFFLVNPRVAPEHRSVKVLWQGHDMTFGSDGVERLTLGSADDARIGPGRTQALGPTRPRTAAMESGESAGSALRWHRPTATAAQRRSQEIRSQDSLGQARTRMDTIPGREGDDDADLIRQVSAALHGHGSDRSSPPSRPPGLRSGATGRTLVRNPRAACGALPRTAHAG